MVMFMIYFHDKLISVRNALASLMESKDHVIAALDGRSAAGKSTSAQWIARELDGEVIHMDDFFLPMELRSEERLSQPGGNVHYERFADEVLSGLKRGEPFDYRVFDCSVMGYGSVMTAGRKHLTIVEGAYSLHPAFERYYDLAIFFDIDPEEQKARILARNGREKLNDFTQKWIPMEERYIAAFDIENLCDMTVGRETK